MLARREPPSAPHSADAKQPNQSPAQNYYAPARVSLTTILGDNLTQPSRRGSSGEKSGTGTRPVPKPRKHFFPLSRLQQLATIAPETQRRKSCRLIGLRAQTAK